MIIIKPTIPTVSRLWLMLPPVLDNTRVALKKTPEPITMPTTMQMAVNRP